jgi:hypothetical protein
MISKLHPYLILLSGGLCALDPKTGKEVNYIHSDKDSTTLSAGVVRVLYEDKEGTIWAGQGFPFSPRNHVGLNKLNRATGLGLSLAYDIITKEHNGTIKVESQEGKGSTFIIQFSIS